MLLRLAVAFLTGAWLRLPHALCVVPLLCVERRRGWRGLRAWSCPVLLALLAGAWQPATAPVDCASGTQLRVVGWVATRPESSARFGTSRCLLRVESAARLEGNDNSRRILSAGRNLLLRARGSLPAYGTRLVVEGSVTLPRPGRHFQGWDERPYLRARQAWGTLSARKLRVLPGVRGAAWRRNLVEPLRSHLVRTVGDMVRGLPQGLLLALLLGIRSDLDDTLRNAWRALGMSHVLALSGMHVGVVAAGLLACVGSVRRRDGLLVLLTGVFGYAAVGGLGSSVLRAACMVACTATATFLGRTRRPLRTLGTAALFLVALTPARLSDLGFQLSCSATLGILLVAAPLAVWVRRQRHRRAALGWLAWMVPAACLGIAAQITTLPWILHHFGMVSWMAPLANLLLVPLVDVALILALSGSVLSLLLPGAARSFLLLSAGLLQVVSWVSLHVVDRVEPRVFLRSDAAVVALASCASLGLVGALLSRRRKRMLLAAAAALALLGVFVLGSGATAPQWRLTMLDVGQGDALVFRVGDAVWLVDAGPTRPVDQGEHTVLPHLRRQGIDHLRGVVVSHPHEDHHGGILAVLRGIRVDTLYVAGASLQHPVYRSWRQSVPQVPQRGLQWGDSLVIGAGTRACVLWPPAEDVLQSGANGVSVSLWVRSQRGPDVLLMGDLEEDGETALVQRWGEVLRSQRGAFLVLKAGHHGSRTSSSPLFLDATDPEVALVSAGLHNRYGHPAASTLQALHQRGCIVLRTDRGGDIRLEQHARQLWLQRPAQRRHVLDDAQPPLTAVAQPD